MVGPRPKRKDYWRRAITGKYFAQQAYDDAVGAWERRRDEENEERRENYRSATSRPGGELEAGIGVVDGQPALYEQGGVTGDPDRLDVYYGSQGPFGSPHGHIVSNDGGVNADYVREPTGEVRVNDRGRKRR